MVLNQNQIYREAASVHGFIDPQKDFAEPLSIREKENLGAKSDHQPQPKGCWWTRCYTYKSLESSWTCTAMQGTQKAKRTLLEASGTNVRAYNVDPVECAVISTSENGGLIVASIHEPEVLWSLPTTYLDANSRVEFDQGFILWDRTDGQFEVWRRSSDSFNFSTYLPCTPDASQIAISPDPVPTFPEFHPPVYSGSDYNGKNSATPGLAQIPSQAVPRPGSYLPFALLQTPVPTQMHSFVYPNLAAVSQRSLEVSIWDIPRTALVQTLHIDPPPFEGAEAPDHHTPGQINGLDVNDDYVLIAWRRSVHVYGRHANTAGSDAATTTFNRLFEFRVDVLRITRDDTSKSPTPSYYVSLGEARPILKTNVSTYAIQPMHTMEHNDGTEDDGDFFVAAHFSPDGRDLAALTERGWLVFLKDFLSRSQDQSTCTNSRPHVRKSFQVLIYGVGITQMAFDGARILLSSGYAVYSITVQDRLRIDDGAAERDLIPFGIQQLCRPDGDTTCTRLFQDSAWWVERSWTATETLEKKVTSLDFTNIEPLAPSSTANNVEDGLTGRSVDDPVEVGDSSVSNGSTDWNGVPPVEE